jgi:hypothetical protein
LIRAPEKDNDGQSFSCSPANIEDCSLHFHSVTTPHNFGRVFSSPAPGFAMGVGSVGSSLLPYEESDTFLSTDAGVTWNMIRRDAHKYGFGDQGGILVVINDEDRTDIVRYSLDLGKTWYVDFTSYHWMFFFFWLTSFRCDEIGMNTISASSSVHAP